MKAPSLVIGFKGEVPSVIYCGADAGKAKDIYQANSTNTDLGGVMLFVRPEYTRRNRPAKRLSPNIAPTSQPETDREPESKPSKIAKGKV